MRALDVGPRQLDELVGGDASALALLDELVAVLKLKLKPERVRAVVHRRAPVYDGRSMLDAIRDGEVTQVLAAVRTSFEWDRADDNARIEVEQRQDPPCA
jgi:hypothetical protein